MAETPPEPGRSRLRTRLSLLLLLVLVFGAPALVTTSLVTQELVGEVTRGRQPGGLVTGRVVEEGGAPVEGHTVSLWLAPSEIEGVLAGPATRTGAEGRFELQAPPVDGFYELRAGGGLVQRVVKALSFLDPEGETIEPRPVTFELRPGAVLELEFIRTGGAAAPDGSYTFEGEQRGRGLLFGFVPYGLRGGGTFEAGRLRLDGIPPMQARLAVVFDTGETAELELEIEAGLNASRIELESGG